jgi:hypothetical protein
MGVTIPGVCGRKVFEALAIALYEDARPSLLHKDMGVAKVLPVPRSEFDAPFCAVPNRLKYPLYDAVLSELRGNVSSVTDKPRTFVVNSSYAAKLDHWHRESSIWQPTSSSWLPGHRQATAPPGISSQYREAHALMHFAGCAPSLPPRHRGSDNAIN